MLLNTAIIAAITFIAAVFGTGNGFGISTIIVPVILFLYPLPAALLFVGIIHFTGDIWKVLFFKHGIRCNLILSFGLPGIIASYLGASLVLSVTGLLMKRILAVFFLVTLAVCIPISFLGAYITKKVVHKIPQKKFRTIIAVFIGLMAIKLLVIP